MEARVAQIPIVDVEDEESDPLNVFPPSQEGSPQLPHDLFGDADDDQLSSRVRDSVASSLIPDTSKGKVVLPPWEKKPELVVERTQGTVPEFTERSRAAPATQMASHMGPDPQTGTVGTKWWSASGCIGCGADEAGPPTPILRWTSPRRQGMAQPNGEIHEADGIPCQEMAGHSGDACGWVSQYLDECAAGPDLQRPASTFCGLGRFPGSHDCCL